MEAWESAFTEFVGERGTALTRYAYLLCGNSSESVDLLQDALVRVFSRARAGAGFDHLEAYVRRAILTAYLDANRRRARWLAVRNLVAQRPVTDGVEDGVVLEHDLRRVLATLPPRERACLVLRFYEDQPVADIAEQLGCSTGAVKRYLSDALKRVAGQLHTGAEEQIR